MKKTFLAFATFIIISFLIIGVIHTAQSRHDAHQQIQTMVDRDLSTIATFAMGPIAQKDYARLEEKVMLKGEHNRNIITFSIMFENGRSLASFKREVTSSDLLRRTHTALGPDGRNILLEMVYDLTAQNKIAAEHSASFFLLGTITTVLFIAALWTILQYMAIRPLRKEITDRKQAEAEREKAALFMQRVIDGVPEAMMVINRDYTIALANQIVRDIAGEQDPVGACLKCHQVSHDSDLPCDGHEHPCPIQQVIETRQAVTMEHTHYDAKGRPFPVEVIAAPIFDESGEVIQIIESSRDISVRKEAEAQQRAILDSLGAGVALVDANNHSILYLNPAAEAIFGAPQHEVLGKKCYHMLCPAEEDKYPVANLSAGTHQVECSLTAADGQAIPIIKTVVPVKIGGKDAFLESFMDLRDLRSLETQLRQSQKMEAVGQLAGGIAHDFNNILQAILGYGEMAQTCVDEGSPVHEYLDQMLKASDRAKTLTSQLLAFSRRQVLQMEDLNLNEVITDLMKMIHRVIGEHITLDVLSGHELGTIRADRGQLGQILTNLCVNARDAMPEGGTITIETENVQIEKAYVECHSDLPLGRYVLLSVTDTGCGMDEETRRQVFEPFFTTKETGKGTGLGLSTVYGLVKQHKGTVGIYSEVGKGTTFKMYLPMVERLATAVGDKIEDVVPDGTETILLAEDDKMVRTMCTDMLEKAGYTVLTARDGKEALRIYREHADEIDMAILDVVMPNLGGKAVFDQIRKTKPEMRFLFASGYSMNAIHTNFVLEEGLSLISKPYQRSQLLRKVREVLDQE